MKIRTGYVANSSSASFLVAGIDVSDVEDVNGLYENVKEWYRMFGYGSTEIDEIKCFEGDEFGESGLPDGLTLIGLYVFVARDDEYLEPMKVDILGILEQVDVLKNFMEMRDRETVFYQGTMSC